MSITAIALHGGAGTILRRHMTADAEAAYRKGLSQALELGKQALQEGAAALDVVEQVVRMLEDNPLYNAGRGAVFAGDGTHRLDAAIMCGRNLEAGSVADVRGVRNPISLARKVMDSTAYVMMVGQGAEAFARQQKLDLQSPEYFFDQLRFDQWQKVRDTPHMQLDHADKGEKNFSTVGAVALDQAGNLASASSTGGMTNKRFGRVGDTPLIGVGTYANNRTCAVACTGHGEPFIRSVVGHTVSALMEFGGRSLMEAGKELIEVRLPQLQGEGGLIAVDGQGNIIMPFNTEGMYRASWREGEQPVVRIYGDEG